DQLLQRLDHVLVANPNLQGLRLVAFSGFPQSAAHLNANATFIDSSRSFIDCGRHHLDSTFDVLFVLRRRPALFVAVSPLHAPEIGQEPPYPLIAGDQLLALLRLRLVVCLCPRGLCWRDGWSEELENLAVPPPQAHILLDRPCDLVV